MKLPCVLVTGVGAIIGQGIIKSLRMVNRPVRIVGLDLNPAAFGARACDAFYAKPGTEEGQPYLDFFDELLEKEKIDIILPGIEHDVFFFDAHREFFRRHAVLPVLNQPELIELARDKGKTAKALVEAGIEVIPGLIAGSWSDCVSRLGPTPWLLKPRHGNGSRGIVKLYDERDFDYWTGLSADQYLVQKIVGCDDEEYTASVFGFGDGDATSSIIFKRRLSVDGSTRSAEIVQHSSIDKLIDQLNRLFKPLGPTNYQFRREAEKIYLLEVNPRISSATSFRAAFDYNEAWMCIDYFVNGIRPTPEAARKGRALRYVDDYIEHL
ncbi:ATP-grasp domain-containing protein [Gammaproteobacteria bacterium]|nr:ATP-grasp domain-containing protein [Gammaproteobacteria bacterium]